MVLRIAVPERGVVADAARSLLDATGYGTSPASLLAAPALLDAPVKVFALPERDIPMYAAEGGLHLAVTGSLSVDEASVAVPVALELDVGAHELTLLTSDPLVRTEGDLHGARVATPLPNLVRRHLATATIAARRVVPSIRWSTPSCSASPTPWPPSSTPARTCPGRCARCAGSAPSGPATSSSSRAGPPATT